MLAIVSILPALDGKPPCLILLVSARRTPVTIFFTRYIRGLIANIVSSNVGCNVGGVCYNILAYADDIVLLASSWKTLRLINLLFQSAQAIDFTCNIDKTVCMVFNPKRRRLVVADDFPPLSFNSIDLKYVSKFKYLGHMINHDFSDDDDIKREIRNMFMRSNILIRRYSRCSMAVKLLMFKACYIIQVIGLRYTIINPFSSTSVFEEKGFIIV